MTSSISLATAMPGTRVSNALSLPGFIGFYFGLRVCLTFLLFQDDPQLGAIVGVALNLILLLPVSIYSFGRGRLAIGKALRIVPVRLTVSFLVFALISLLWSETSSKAVALGYWTALAVDVVIVLLLMRADGAAQAAEALFKGFIFGVFVLCFVAWSAPAMKDLRLGDDEFLTPNIIGFQCAFGVLLCHYFAPQGARWKLLGVALALTLVRSLSKTSIASFVIVEAAYLLRNRVIRRATKAKLAIAALGVGLAFSGLFSRYYDIYLNAGNQAETLTGRTSIWLVTFGYALEKPWLGHGFHSFRTVIPPFGAFQPWHAHNDLLQQFFAYGIVGVVLIVALYVCFFRLCNQQRAHSFALTGIALLQLVLIRGLADTERFDISFPLWAITGASLLLSAREAQA